MIAKCFVDTNILIYSRDQTEPGKQEAAMLWLEFLWKNRNGCLSYQVLQEYYVTVTQKLSHGLSRQDAQDDIRSLLKWQPLAIDQLVLEDAWSIQNHYNYSFWDAMILAAARLLDCAFLLTEDMQENQEIDNLKIINPFSNRPAEIYQ